MKNTDDSLAWTPFPGMLQECEAVTLRKLQCDRKQITRPGRRPTAELLGILKCPQESHWNRNLSDSAEPGWEEGDSVPGPGGSGTQPELHNTGRFFSRLFYRVPSLLKMMWICHLQLRYKDALINVAL